MNAFQRTLSVFGSFALGLVVFGVVYIFIIRPWHRAWGTTDTEETRVMPGDDLVTDPNYLATRAVTIRARPEEIWPWLVQMGYKRGGLYSYDWLDRALGILDRPSADTLLPDFQDIKVGDQLPMGFGPSWPVQQLEKNKSIVLDIKQKGVHISWSFGIYPAGDITTRLILRTRGHLALELKTAPVFAALDPAEFVMVRKMLTGIRERVEGIIKTPTEEFIELMLWALALLAAVIATLAAFMKKGGRQSFILAWVSFIVLFYLALGQPPLIAGIGLDLLLLLGTFWALRKRRLHIE